MLRHGLTTIINIDIMDYFQVMKASMWIMLEILLFGAILLYSTVSDSLIDHLISRLK